MYFAFVVDNAMVLWEPSGSSVGWIFVGDNLLRGWFDHIGKQCNPIEVVHIGAWVRIWDERSWRVALLPRSEIWEEELWSLGEAEVNKCMFVEHPWPCPVAGAGAVVNQCELGEDLCLTGIRFPHSVAQQLSLIWHLQSGRDHICTGTVIPMQVVDLWHRRFSPLQMMVRPPQLCLVTTTSAQRYFAASLLPPTLPLTTCVRLRSHSLPD